MRNMTKKLLISTIFLIFLIPVFAGTIESTNSVFNVTPDIIYFNWDDSGLGAYTWNVTIGWENDTSGVVEVVNSTAVLKPTFITPVRCEYSDGYQEPGTELLVHCSRLWLEPSNTTSSLSSGENETLTLFINSSFLYPGHYEGDENITFRAVSDHSENLTVFYAADIPIKFEERCESFGKYGNVEYKIPANNSGKDDAQYFYFNISEIENVSSFWINITNETEIFLFDENDNYLSGGSEINIYSSGNNSYWKIYVYGNDTNDITYEGYICGYTLHLLDSADQDVENIDLGVFNLSDDSTISRENTLKLYNMREYNYSTVYEDLEIYREEEFTSSSDSNFTFLVSPLVRKIEAELEWEEDGNYSLTMIMPNGTSIVKATHDPYEDIMNVTRTVKISYENPVSGEWEIRIKNQTQDTPSYTLTIRLYQNVFEGNISNYTAKNFSSYEINIVNFTTSIRKDVMNGTYKGTLRYYSEEGEIDVPINFTVSTAYFIFNTDINGTAIKTTRNMYRYYKYNVSLTINNTGDQNITNISVSYTNLTYSENSNCFAKITNVYYNDTLPSGSSQEVLVEIEINETNATCEGIYKGYVTFNMTNSTYNVSPNPVQKAEIDLNLTKWLDTKIIGITPNPVNITESEKNLTIDFQVKYVNGSNFEWNGIYLENITNISLINKNLTWYFDDKTSSKQYTTPSNVLNNGTGTGLFYVNFSLDEDELPGGYYTVLLKFKDKDGNLFGEDTYLLNITDEGLYPEVVYYNRTMYNNTWYWLNITITNFGTVKSSYSKLLVDSSVITNFDEIYKNCSGTTTEGDNYTIIPSLDPQKTCFIALKIKTQSSSGSGTLVLKGISGKWYKNVTKNIDIQEITSSSSSSEQNEEESENSETLLSPQQNNTENTSVLITYNLSIYSYPKMISVVQGKKKTVNVDVKNKGNGTLKNLSLEIEGIDETWSNYVEKEKDKLNPGETYRFKVEISIPQLAKVGNYSFYFVVKGEPNISEKVESLLVIEPSEEYKTQMEILLKSLNETLINLTKKFELLKEKLGEDNENITELAKKIKSIEDNIKTVEEYIAKGDYSSVEMYLQTAQQMKNKVEEEMEILEEVAEAKKKARILKIIGGVVLLIIGGVIIYLLLPPPHGYEPEKGYRYVPKPHRGKPRIKRIIEELKEKWNEIKRKFKKEEKPYY